MIDEYIQRIIEGVDFQKLKNIIENNPFHDHEDVYAHSLLTLERARKEIQGAFITNPQAKEAFIDFTQKKFGSFANGDLMLLTALLHDIGKILSYEEDGSIQPLLAKNESGVTAGPGHEYRGSIFVTTILQDISLPEEAIQKIAKVIRLHDLFSHIYFASKEDVPTEQVISDMKARGEDVHGEVLFNLRCDTLSAVPAKNAIARGVEIFNTPYFYTKRIYKAL